MLKEIAGQKEIKLADIPGINRFQISNFKTKSSVVFIRSKQQGYHECTTESEIRVRQKNLRFSKDANSQQSTK